MGLGLSPNLNPNLNPTLTRWADGAVDKDDALQSADTAAMNRDVALSVKAFVEGGTPAAPSAIGA